MTVPAHIPKTAVVQQLEILLCQFHFLTISTSNV